MIDTVRLHFWLPGLHPDRDPASLIINTPEALQFVLHTLRKEQNTTYLHEVFSIVAKQGDEVTGSGQYEILFDGIAILQEENLHMLLWWNA